jgi:hypothetical protein
MKNIKYFEEYERRKRTRFGIGTGKMSLVTETTLPKYRLQKVYDYNNGVRYVKDIFLEVSYEPYTKWDVLE